MSSVVSANNLRNHVFLFVIILAGQTEITYNNTNMRNHLPYQCGICEQIQKVYFRQSTGAHILSVADPVLMWVKQWVCVAITNTETQNMFVQYWNRSQNTWWYKQLYHTNCNIFCPRRFIHTRL